MNGLTVRLFMPGLDPGGQPARARFAGGGLHLDWDDGRLVVPALRLELRLGGFDGRQWMLAWSGESGPASILLPSGAEAQRFLVEAPAGLADAAARQGRRARTHGFGFRLGVGVVVMLFLLPFFLLAAFWVNSDRIAGWAVDRIGLDQERQLGELAFAQMRPGLKLVESGPALAMVRDLGARLTAGSRYRYQWFVAESPEVNAFAMPGGYVVVQTGLVEAADSAEEVAGVLAHEVQHVELRHSLKNLVHGLGWRAVLALALGDVSGSIWAGMANELGSMAYGRDLERQADLEGLKALRRAGIAPDGMLSFFGKQAGREGAPPAWLSTHPASRERLDNLRRALAEQGAYPATSLPPLPR